MSSSRTSIATSTEYGPGEQVSVLLPLPLAGAYDYRVPESLVLHDGDIVLAPLGVRRCPGVVWGDAQGDVDNSKLKEIISVLEAPLIPDVSRRFVDWIAAYTCSPPGAVLKMVISVPDALEPPKPVTAYQIREPLDPTLKLTAARKRVLEVLAGGPPRVRGGWGGEKGLGPLGQTGLACGGMAAKPGAAPGPPEVLYPGMPAPEPAPGSIWSVFDGKRPSPDSGDSNPRIVFAPSADQWIVARVRKAENPQAFAVVSADHQVGGRCRHAGAQVVAPRDFIARCPPSEP